MSDLKEISDFHYQLPRDILKVSNN